MGIKLHDSILSLSCRVHWQSASQSAHAFQSCADSPTQEDEEQDDQMQAVWQLHCCQRGWMWGGMRRETLTITRCSEKHDWWWVKLFLLSVLHSIAPSVRAGFAQEVYGGVSARVWTQEGYCVRSGPLSAATWQTGAGALCGAALHVWDRDSCSHRPGIVYRHSDRKCTKEYVTFPVVIPLGFFLFFLWGGVSCEWVQTSHPEDLSGLWGAKGAGGPLWPLTAWHHLHP